MVFKPHFNRHKHAALQAQRPAAQGVPIAMIVFPGLGIIDNLADKARNFGIPLFDFRDGRGG